MHHALPLTPEFFAFYQSEIRIPQSEMLPSPLYLLQQMTAQRARRNDPNRPAPCAFPPYPMLHALNLVPLLLGPTTDLSSPDIS